MQLCALVPSIVTTNSETLIKWEVKTAKISTSSYPSFLSIRHVVVTNTDKSTPFRFLEFALDGKHMVLYVHPIPRQIVY